jgi:surface antigen
MGGYLTRNGFRQVSTPSAGAIVIFQPSFGPGIRAAGHVGVIESVSSVNSNRDWRITVRGANQGVAGSAEHGCSNVSSVRYKAFPKTSTSVSYYVRASR